MTSGGEQLYDATGRRKYVCGSERSRFVDAADRADRSTRNLGLLLVYSGCRISEALGVTPAQLDVETGHVVFRTLKRRRVTFRSVPIPPALMRELRGQATGLPTDAPLWSFCRVTAWRRIKRLMAAAGIRGSQATAKGLRHGFGIANAEENIPPALTQRWMGHARLETTAIYQHAVGNEERAFAQRIWRRSEKRRH